MRVLSILCALVLAAVATPQNVRAGTVYAIDGINDEIVTIDMLATGELRRFPTPEPCSGGPDGLAVTGDTMFFVNGNGSNRIIRLNPQTGTVTDSFPAPELFGGSDGLAAMDDTLFTLEPASDTISRLRISTGEALGSCTTGMMASGGLAAEAGRLFATLSLVNIVELDPLTCRLIAGPFPVPEGDLALGLAFDGELLYAGSYIRPGIHMMDPDTGDAIGFHALDYAPTGLAATAEAVGPECTFDVDYRPGSPANILNLMSRGRIPVALFGSDSMDTGDIDQTSLVLSGVPAAHSAFEDVDGDGILDLILHFGTQALVTSLTTEHGELQDGMVLDITLRGERMDGTGCFGEDSIRIRDGVPGGEQQSRNRPDRRGSR